MPYANATLRSVHSPPSAFSSQVSLPADFQIIYANQRCWQKIWGWNGESQGIAISCSSSPVAQLAVRRSHSWLLGQDSPSHSSSFIYTAANLGVFTLWCLCYVYSPRGQIIFLLSLISGLQHGPFLNLQIFSCLCNQYPLFNSLSLNQPRCLFPWWTLTDVSFHS